MGRLAKLTGDLWEQIVKSITILARKNAASGSSSDEDDTENMIRVRGYEDGGTDRDELKKEKEINAAIDDYEDESDSYPYRDPLYSMTFEQMIAEAKTLPDKNITLGVIIHNLDEDVLDL